MTTTASTALVGCGKVGHTHARALRALPQSRFIAVCDPMEERAVEFGLTYGVEAYTSLEAMLLRERPDVVTVCTPHPTHADVVALCADSGANVLVEKPLAPDLAGCDRAIEACVAAQVKLGVISQRRLYRPVMRLKTRCR